jgi:hypothetical protein
MSSERECPSPLQEERGSQSSKHTIIDEETPIHDAEMILSLGIRVNVNNVSIGDIIECLSYRCPIGIPVEYSNH